MALKKPAEAEPKTEVKTTDTQVTTQNKQVSPLWWIFGTLLSVVILLFILGAVKHFMYAYSYDSPRDIRSGNMYDRSFDRRGMRGGMMDDDTLNTTRVSGVVTAIDNGTLTVAGNGTTKQIKTTDTTEYYGAAQPVKVNDSVHVMGTTEGDVFTATRVMISRQ